MRFVYKKVEEVEITKGKAHMGFNGYPDGEF
jgi:hypothetical protein